MSTLRTNTITDAAGANSMPVADINQGRAKAWYNLNGTGSISERDSFNISSFVDNGTGNYQCNFSSVFSNANYSFGTTTGDITGAGNVALAFAFGQTAALSKVAFYTTAPAPNDMNIVTQNFHGDR